MILNRLEIFIRKSPVLYVLLRPLIPFINIFIAVERDFIGLKMISFPKNGGVAVDVGFNDGLSSTSIRRYTRLPIVAFEPLEIRLNPLFTFLLRNVKIHKFGLSNKNLSTTLYTPIYKGFTGKSR